MKDSRTPAGGPAALLAPGKTWIADRRNVAFQVPEHLESALEVACWALWELSRAVRARRGEMGLSQFDVSVTAAVRRQTVAELEMGTTWPDAATVARICHALGLGLVAVRRDDQEQAR